eukprot:CAMPEP_0170075374 /NCGR_PEP_ID=MMETSP0019_2-20121128/12519_1 /TAXON_ID=98059 /ORGANISM="Dinobryon sp., Strain UTEXLB2267" /LENGTH=380 /DNA_ID=CAMNT_0010286295 /DNA_START=1075 /DNA_END=2217 /DNA_ORIENTATION=+
MDQQTISTGTVSLNSIDGRKPGISNNVVIFGVLITIICIILGAILSYLKVNHSSPYPYPIPDIPTFVQLWDASNPQFLMLISIVSIFILRKYLISFFVGWLYKHLPQDKQAKCANYLLELFTETIVLILFSFYGFWTLFFYPPEIIDVTIPMVKDYATGFFTSANIVVSSYIIEMAFDSAMRYELMLHHWVTITLILWAQLAMFDAHYGVKYFRLCCSFLLYMCTEQNVFVELLFYYRSCFYWPVVYYLSAIYYLVSRIFIAALVFWTWEDAVRDAFTKYNFNSTAMFSVLLFIPFGNLILLMTQWSTIVNLFGIAAKVSSIAVEKSSSNNGTAKEDDTRKGDNNDGSEGVQYGQLSSCASFDTLCLTKSDSSDWLNEQL